MKNNCQVCENYGKTACPWHMTTPFKYRVMIGLIIFLSLSIPPLFSEIISNLVL